MSTNQRIFINTAATYTRTVFAAALMLFSSRWVLSALGHTDYGLFSVVGSVILFVTFLNTVLAGSAARYFAYHIGQSDFGEVRRWFNSALGIHLCLAVLLLIVGWQVGEYLVSHVLTIPQERMTACLGVFRISLVSAFFCMVAVPFTAMFSAKQHIAELAFWGIIQAFLAFALACSLQYISGDRLLLYAAGMVAIIVFVQIAQILRALIVFSECRICLRELFDRHRLRSIFSFAIWNLIGSSGALFRDQGSTILLNIFCGPTVNAAYGIATQVSSQANQLSAAMIGAFSPEITACEGRGDRARMLSLSQRASKFGTILVLLPAIPLIVEMDYVLKLWLHVPPPHSALFCQLILVTFLIDRLSVGYMLAVNAHGKIAAYQATLGTTLVLTLPLGWLLLKLGFAPTSIGMAFIATMIVTSIGRVLWGRHLLGMPVLGWWKVVVVPTSVVAIVGTVAALSPGLFLTASLLRLLLVATASVSASVLTAWLLAVDDNERQFVRQGAHKFMVKLGVRQATTAG